MKVGAQKCVTQRVRNSAGSAMSRGLGPPAAKKSRVWSSAISSMTSPRSRSTLSRRARSATRDTSLAPAAGGMATARISYLVMQRTRRHTLASELRVSIVRDRCQHKATDRSAPYTRRTTACGSWDRRRRRHHRGMLARTCGCARRLGWTVLRRIGPADRKPHRRWARWGNCACNAAYRSRRFPRYRARLSRLCSRAVGLRCLEPACQRVCRRVSARELRCQRKCFSCLFHHGREAWDNNHPPGPEIDLLFGRHRGGIRDDRLHDCLLLVSNRVSHSRDHFRHTMLDLGPQPSRSRVEVAGGGGLNSHALVPCDDFPGFGHDAKYAPSGMLGRPEAAAIIKRAHYQNFGYRAEWLG